MPCGQINGEENYSGVKRMEYVFNGGPMPMNTHVLIWHVRCVCASQAE